MNTGLYSLNEGGAFNLSIGGFQGLRRAVAVRLIWVKYH